MEKRLNRSRIGKLKMSNYPNFELIEERFWNTYRPMLEKALGTDRIYPKYSMDCFEQVWGSSTTGFSGTVGCDIITREYTTVVSFYYSAKLDGDRRFKDFYPDVYGVFFGNRLAYIINSPNELFYEDLKNREMRSTGEMSAYYKSKQDSEPEIQGMEYSGEIEIPEELSTEQDTE